MSEKLISKIVPSIETIIMSPMSGGMQKVISCNLAVLTESKLDDLGYVGSACWLNTKDNTRMIVSKFLYDHVTAEAKTGFGSSLTFIPELNNLAGYFYYGNIENYIYDIDVDSNSIIFKWHMDILLAYLTDTSLLDSNFKITHKAVVKDKKKAKRNDHEPIMLFIERAYRNANESVATFSPEDIEEYFAKLLK